MCDYSPPLPGVIPLFPITGLDCRGATSHRGSSCDTHNAVGLGMWLRWRLVAKLDCPMGRWSSGVQDHTMCASGPPKRKGDDGSDPSSPTFAGVFALTQQKCRTQHLFLQLLSPKWSRCPARSCWSSGAPPVRGSSIAEEDLLLIIAP